MQLKTHAENVNQVKVWYHCLYRRRFRLRPQRQISHRRDATTSSWGKSQRLWRWLSKIHFLIFYYYMIRLVQKDGEWLTGIIFLSHSGSREVTEDLPHSHQADGAGLQVQRAEATWDLRYHRGLSWACTLFWSVDLSLWVALVTDWMNCLFTHNILIFPFVLRFS